MRGYKVPISQMGLWWAGVEIEGVGEEGRVGEVTGKRRAESGGWDGCGNHRGMRRRRAGSWGYPRPPLPLLVFVCSINWAIYIASNNNLLLLVEIRDFAAKNYFQVVSYDLGNWDALGG